jgi:hypothetical protein
VYDSTHQQQTEENEMNTQAQAPSSAFAKYIAVMLNINDQDAQLVFEEMRSSGFNFKLCTEEKFMREAKIALKVVRLPS